MTKPKDPENALRRLGQRLREAWTRQPPHPDKNLAVFKDAIRDEWNRERAHPPAPRAEPPARDNRERHPDEPER